VPLQEKVADTDALSAASLARLSDGELLDLTAQTSRQVAALTGRLVALAGEADRRQAWRSEGATSLEAWLVERTGVSVPTARAQAQVAGRLFDLPRLAEGLAAGDLSFDKVRAVVEVATPESDAALCHEAQDLSVRQLAEVARAGRPPSGKEDAADYERRSVRFNDRCRTMTAQLPADSYAEVKGALEAGAKEQGGDAERALDQRVADALVSLVRSSGPGRGAPAPYVVVAHVPLEVLLDEEAELPAELEAQGLISAEALRRLACDATLVIAADDGAGHTLYEGRGRRYPSATQRREITRRDRHCRFPGCTNATFVHPHHIRRWKPDRGPTDIENLALMCDHHHHLVHSKAWTMRGNANEELTFLGPSGRVMTSRPSPLWTRVSAPRG
jgi:hypothetical protein